MLEILQFIFSSFWIFCGSVILLYLLVYGSVALAAIFCGAIMRVLK